MYSIKVFDLSIKEAKSWQFVATEIISLTNWLYNELTQKRHNIGLKR